MTANTKQDLIGEALTLKYVPIDSELYQWERNLKKHDMGGIIQSIRRHGFKDPMKYEPKLNNGAGGFVEGNGRNQALHLMYKQWVTEKKPSDQIPRGIMVDADGKWYIPVLFGVDSDSQNAAEAYGIDHNNLTLWGGDFSLQDLGRMYNDGIQNIYRELLESGEQLANIIVDDILALDEFDFDDFKVPTNTNVYYRLVVDNLSKENAEILRDQLGKGRVEIYRTKEEINEE